MSVSQSRGESVFSFELGFFWINIVRIKICIVFQFIILWIVTIVGWTKVLFKSCILSCHFYSALYISVKVESWENTVIWNHVILPMRFIVVIMLEWGHILSSKPKGNEWVSIIDGIQILSMQKSLDIVFDDSTLGESSIVRWGCWNICAWSKGKNIFVFSWLKSVRVNINETISIDKWSSRNFFLWFWWRLSNKLIEILLNGFSSINVSKNTPIFSLRSLRDFKKFPTKVYFNVSLSALVKSNFVCIIKIENSLVWSPILNSCIIWGSSLKFFLFK